MQMNGLGYLSYRYAAKRGAASIAAATAKRGAANQALLNVQLHNFYLAKLAAYTAASTAEAKALLGVATANAGTNQTAINQAVNTALICENNSLMAYADMSSAAQQDSTLQAQLAAQATAAAYAAAKAAMLPAGGYWNSASWMPQYVIDAPTFAAMQSGRTIYNWWGATSVMLGRPVLCFCNNFYRANPGCTLDQVNAYGGQLSAAAQSSDSFGSFLMGALPYIAIVAVMATAVVFTAGALAPAAQGLSTGAGGALTTGGGAAGGMTNAQIISSGMAEGDAGGGAVAGGLGTGAGASLGTGAGGLLTTGGGAGGGGGILTTLETAGGAAATSSIESKLVGGIKNLFNPQPAAPAPGAPVAAPKQSSFLTPAIMVAGIGLVFELLKN